MMAPVSAVRRTVLALALASVSLTSCARPFIVRGATSPVRPVGVSRSPDQVFGETVRVTMRPLRLFGELIACDRDWLYLRVHERGDAAWRRIHWSENPAVDVALPSNGPALLAWSLVGTVSTISHGFFAIISATVWAAAGTAASWATWSPRLGLESCERARPFARFPQGLPESFSDRFNGVFDEAQTQRSAPSPAAYPPVSLPAPWATPTPDAPATP